MPEDMGPYGAACAQPSLPGGSELALCMVGAAPPSVHPDLSC